MDKNILWKNVISYLVGIGFSTKTNTDGLAVLEKSLAPGFGQKATLSRSSFTVDTLLIKPDGSLVLGRDAAKWDDCLAKKRQANNIASTALMRSRTNLFEKLSVQSAS